MNCVTCAITSVKHAPMPLNALLEMLPNSESLLPHFVPAWPNIMTPVQALKHVLPVITLVPLVRTLHNA